MSALVKLVFLNFGKLLGAIATLALIIGCQKAKLESVPRKAPSEKQNVDTSTPPPRDSDVVPEVQPPAPRPEQENDDPVVETDPEDDTEDDITIGPAPAPPPQPVPTPAPLPVYQHQNPPPKQVSEQPEIKEEENNVIEWLLGGYAPSFLDKCSWKPCEEVEPEPPAQEEEKKSKPIQQPKKPITSLVDILFVVDTSNSLDSERANVANNFDRYLNEVGKLQAEKGLDFKIGVLLAHGPNTQTQTADGSNVFSRLFVHPNEGVQGQSLITGDNIASVKSALATRFSGNGDIKSIRDKSKTQGEAGLLALQGFLEKAINGNDLGAPGNSEFPRKDAALAIFFISDENDVCYDYSRMNKEYAAKNIRRVDSPKFASPKSATHNGITRDIPEHTAFMNECAAGATGQAETVFELLKKAKGHSPENLQNIPIIVQGILYPTKSEAETARNTSKDKFAKDNEMGHGYLNLIQMLNGEVVNVRQNDFAKDLVDMGQLAKFKMEFVDEILLKDADGNLVDANSVDLNSIRVEVVLGANVVELKRDTQFKVETYAEPGGKEIVSIQLLRKGLEGIDLSSATVQSYYRKKADY